MQPRLHCSDGEIEHHEVTLTPVTTEGNVLGIIGGRAHLIAPTKCIGHGACRSACPYDAIFINPEDHSAEKCNFCAHRLEVGLEPACVVV